VAVAPQCLAATGSSSLAEMNDMMPATIASRK
jgi:hypothetical protein